MNRSTTKFVSYVLLLLLFGALLPIVLLVRKESKIDVLLLGLRKRLLLSTATSHVVNDEESLLIMNSAIFPNDDDDDGTEEQEQEQKSFSASSFLGDNNNNDRIIASSTQRRGLANAAMAAMHNKRTKENRETSAIDERTAPPRKECPPEKRETLEPEEIKSNSNKQYKLSDQAEYWCHPTELNPLHYESCDHDGIYYEIPFMAGLTNGFKMMLLAVITAFEENRCLYVTEWNHLMRREDKSQELKTFIGRYFDPIGLPLKD